MQLHLINSTHLTGLKQHSLMHCLKDTSIFNGILMAGFLRVNAAYTTPWCRCLMFMYSTQSYIGIVHPSRILPRRHRNNNGTILTWTPTTHHTPDNCRLSLPASALTAIGAGINQLYYSSHTYFRHNSHPTPASLLQSRLVPPEKCQHVVEC